VLVCLLSLGPARLARSLQNVPAAALHGLDDAGASGSMAQRGTRCLDL